MGLNPGNYLDNQSRHSGYLQPGNINLHNDTTTFQAARSQDTYHERNSGLPRKLNLSVCENKNYHFQNISYCTSGNSNMETRHCVASSFPSYSSFSEAHLSHNLQQFSQDTTSLHEDLDSVSFKEALPVLGSKIENDEQPGNKNLLKNPYLYSYNKIYDNFTFLSYSHLKFGDERSDQRGSCIQTIDKAGLTKVDAKDRCKHDRGVSTGGGTTAVVSPGCGGNDSCELNVKPKTENGVHSGNATSDAYMNVGVELRNPTTILKSAVPTVIPNQEEMILKNMKLDNGAPASVFSESVVIDKRNEIVTESGNQFGANNSSLNGNTYLDGNSGEQDDQLYNVKQTNGEGRKISKVMAEKLWEGLLQLSASARASAIAIFKSGEKARGIKWSRHIEVKGKVKLQAFEKFIQELPRSRSRGMMVISLCWNVDSSRDGLMDMKEVSKDYVESNKVGFAKISSGIDLYVCPHSEAIITILAKYGFFKGMSAVEDNKDSLIGCVIWRRSQVASETTAVKLEKKEDNLPDECSNSAESRGVQNDLSSHNQEIKHSTKSTIEAGGVCIPHVTKVTAVALECQVEESPRTSTTDTTFQKSTPLILGNSLNIPIHPHQVREPVNSSVRDSALLAEVPKNYNLVPKQSDVGSENECNQQSLSGPPPYMLPKVDSENVLSIDKLHNVGVLQNTVTSVSRVNSAGNDILEVSNTYSGFNMTINPLPGLPPIGRVLTDTIQHHRDQGYVGDKAKEKAGMIQAKPGDLAFSILPSQKLPKVPVRSSDSTNDNEDDLPEFDFSSACRVLHKPSNLQTTLVGCRKRPATPSPMPGQVMQKKHAPDFQCSRVSTLEAGKYNRKILELNNINSRSDSGATHENTPLFSRRPGKNMWDDDDDDDMPEWCPPNYGGSNSPDRSTQRSPLSCTPAPVTGLSMPPIPSKRPSQQSGMLGPRPLITRTASEPFRSDRRPTTFSNSSHVGFQADKSNNRRRPDSLFPAQRNRRH